MPRTRTGWNGAASFENRSILAQDRNPGLPLPNEPYASLSSLSLRVYSTLLYPTPTKQYGRYIWHIYKFQIFAKPTFAKAYMYGLCSVESKQKEAQHSTGELDNYN